MTISIRTEQPADFAAVAEVVGAAFNKTDEVDLVAALRSSDAYLPEYSLVAEDDTGIVGHIFYSRLTVGGSPGIALAPLAVRPDRQKQGVGEALMRESFRLAEAAGETVVLVLGHTAYYPRVGFRPCSQVGIEGPWGHDAFMALFLGDGPHPQGWAQYPPELSG